MIKALKNSYPYANIVAVDYDPGASEVNQLNRIKLMISVAKANMAEAEKKQQAHSLPRPANKESCDKMGCSTYCTEAEIEELKFETKEVK